MGMTVQSTAAATGTKIQILHRWDGRVLFECDVTAEQSGMAMRVALENATRSGADLSGADLRSADLRSADLRSADLSGADLSSAVLSGADLSGADLRSADLRSADLRSADLRSAVLSGAVLSGADLRSADLSGADLSAQKTDFFDILLRAHREVAGLRLALVEGRVDGSTYEGSCTCLVGTIANVRGNTSYASLGNGISPNSSRPAEQWFMGICRGDTPETSQISALTVEWLDEFVALLNLAKAA
jgi:uncharacterized protein YjbI with pentapeptide repeats